jgi:pimeloyl-ACP methyl ester carboxylesterase
MDGLATLATWQLFTVLTNNWALVAMAFTIVTLVVVPWFVIRKYARISLNILRDTKPPLARGPLDFDRLIGESITFPAYDGLQLAGMLIRANPAVPRRGLIVFAHEFCSDMHSCARYCRPLRLLGYDIFTFDFRGHGESPCPPGYTPRQWVTDHELHDMRGALAWVERRLEDEGLPARVGVVGVSRGACAAIVVAEEDPRVIAMAVDGAFSTDTTIEYFMRRWAYIFATVRVIYENHPPAFWRFLRWTMMCMARREFGVRFPSVRKAIVRMKPRPMFFIHGEKDSYLPVEQSRMLYALAGQPKQLWIAPGARHNQAVVVHPEHYTRRTIAFFNRHLGGDPAALDTAAFEPPRDAGSAKALLQAVGAAGAAGESPAA